MVSLGFSFDSFPYNIWQIRPKQQNKTFRATLNIFEFFS